MKNPYPNIYPSIRSIPKEAWKKKAWPITEQKIIKPTLEGKQDGLFEKKKEVKERLPYKDDEVPF